MAKFSMEGFGDLAKSLEKIGKYDEYAPDILNGSLDALKKNIIKRAKQHQKTGDMADSIKQTPAKKNKYGWFSTISPSGTDKNGMRNMTKLAYIEYGTSHQDPHPIIAPAVNESSQAVKEKMQEIFNEKVGEAFEP